MEGRIIKNISNDNNKDLCEILKKNFNYGYNFYEYYHSKYNKQDLHIRNNLNSRLHPQSYSYC